MQSDNDNKSMVLNVCQDNNKLMHKSSTSMMETQTCSNNRRQLCDLKLEIGEVDKLFEILCEGDSNGFSNLFDQERQRTALKPIRRFAPYPIHQQLYLQQHREQERRRQSLISIASRRSTNLSRDFQDSYRCQDIKLLYSVVFRMKIVQSVIDIINKHSERLISIQDDCSEKCIICMYNYQKDQDLRKLKCKHQFHRICIDEWLVKSYLCPVCRADLTGTGKTFKGLAILHYRHEEQHLDTQSNLNNSI